MKFYVFASNWFCNIMAESQESAISRDSSNEPRKYISSDNSKSIEMDDHYIDLNQLHQPPSPSYLEVTKCSCQPRFPRNQPKVQQADCNIQFLTREILRPPLPNRATYFSIKSPTSNFTDFIYVSS